MMNQNKGTIKIALMLVALTTGAPVAMAQGTDKAHASADAEAAVRENVRQMENGWNTKSGTLFARPFAADADYVVINGVHLHGRDVIEKSHQQIFDTVFKESVISLSVKQIRLIRPDVALVYVNSHLKTGQSGVARDGYAILSMVMTIEKGEWKINAFHNTAIGNDSSHGRSK